MTDTFYSQPEWRALRLKALRRDRWRCCLCGAKIHGRGQAHVDHIKGRRRHPELALTLSNLQSLCAHCHNSTKQTHEKNPDGGANEEGFPLDGSWD